ncbi:MAG: hypothetical protein CSA42_01895 [Gammaproteobacteria bacterium]|nr:MAG: hypothetical protein CSA42_01895 [Gammaproteobacteria bacterium]
MKLEEVEALFNQCEQDLKRFESIKEEIKQIEANHQQLSDYYENQYLKDMDNPKYKQLPFGCLSEDGIWNVLTSLDIERVNLIKLLVNNMKS